MSRSCPNYQDKEEGDTKLAGSINSSSYEEDDDDDGDEDAFEEVKESPTKDAVVTASKRKRPGQQQQEPVTRDGERPQKKFYRQRAHCNPLSHNDSFTYPIRGPHEIDWTAEHYPALPAGTVPTVLDIGCGFGGLTLALSTLLPSECILGMEIRAKVTEYVRLRIVSERQERATAAASGEQQQQMYQNCSVLRTNSMKFMPNFFRPASIRKLFFCFPDPHFKRKNHPRRIISERLLSEYAYVLQPTEGRLYCITDVKELHDWHVQKCDAHPLFRRVTDATLLERDVCVQAMKTETEEGKKVERSGGDNKRGEKYYAVYQRIPNGEAPTVNAGNFFPNLLGCER